MKVNFPINRVSANQHAHFSRLKNNLSSTLDSSKIKNGLTDFVSQAKQPVRRFLLAGTLAAAMTVGYANNDGIQRTKPDKDGQRIAKTEYNKNKNSSDWWAYALTGLAVIGTGLGGDALVNAIIRKREKKAETDKILKEAAKRLQNNMQNDEMFRIERFKYIIQNIGSIKGGLAFRMYDMELSMLRLDSVISSLAPWDKEEKFPSKIDCDNLKSEIDGWITKLESGDKIKVNSKNDYYNLTIEHIQDFLKYYHGFTKYDDKIGNAYYQKCKADIYNFIDKMRVANSAKEQFKTRHSLICYITDEMSNPSELIKNYEERYTQLWAERSEENERILLS